MLIYSVMLHSADSAKQTEWQKKSDVSGRSIYKQAEIDVV